MLCVPRAPCALYPCPLPLLSAAHPARSANGHARARTDRGFITGSVDGGSYSQRNTFFYPPQTAERCALSNGTYVEGEACGSSGALRTFQADQ